MAANRAFLVSLGVSAAFHVSMVTIFSIVFLFPVQNIEYYDFQIVEQRTAPVAPSPDLPDMPGILEGGRLRLPQTPELSEPMAGSLPPIELPRLEFAELELLQVRERALRARSRYDGILSPPLRDSWDRLGEGIARLSDALSPRRLFDWTPEEEEEQPQLVTRPAPGFAAYIEWMSEPKSRALLFSPPIEALWGLRPEDFEGPVTLVFRVNPEGEVVEVLTPLADEAGIVVSAARALTRYRFEPLEDGGARDQHGSLFIAVAADGAAP